MVSTALAATEGASSRLRAVACSRLEGGGTSKSGEITVDLEELVARLCAGDESAWQPLWCALDPWLESLVVRRRLIGPLSRRDDDRRGAVVMVMARLRQNDFQRLRLYRAERLRKPTLTLMPWLSVVAKNVGVDYLRAHPNFVATGNRERSERRGEVLDPEPLPPGSRGPGARPQLTREISARQMLDWARRNLPGDQCRALQLRIENDRSDGDIAREMGLPTAEAAQRLVRAAEARLRRQFRGTEEPR